MFKKEGKNNVMRNRVFVQNQNVDSKPSDKNKTTRPQSKPQKKKGGTKVRTKKKKSRFY
jgi:hypothetical protein